MSPEFVRARLNTFMLQDYVKLCRWASNATFRKYYDLSKRRGLLAQRQSITFHTISIFSTPVQEPQIISTVFEDSCLMRCNVMSTGISHQPFGSEQCFHLKGQAALFSDCWILNMEAIRPTATSANICRSTRHNIPETWILSSFLLPVKRKYITMWKWVKLYKKLISGEFEILHLQRIGKRISCNATLSKYNTLIKTRHRRSNAV